MQNNLPKLKDRTKQAMSRGIAILQRLVYRPQLHTLSTSERQHDSLQKKEKGGGSQTDRDAEKKL
ncbi:hypothetical protein EYF80_016570 [Liparis tanakae]|uniref:Uncharacterized protein n=1 Tax=Liparis tanakae TaxID=230148 RepID=A0A4Z2I5A8_9TELE|nr:hypothetical protein EYF80_016570 [Liparis tanakae]